MRQPRGFRFALFRLFFSLQTFFLYIGSHPGVFDSHIKQGKDINPHNEVRMFLKSLLQEETIDFEKFRKHPFYQNVPYVQMEETYDYLTTLEYNKASILNALHILLYPK